MATVSFSSKRSLSKAELEAESTNVRISINPLHASYLQSVRASGGSISLSGGPDQDGCCFLLFDRAAKSWWNPHFDSQILEQQYRKSTFPQTCQRFQYSLFYIFVASISYCIYFASMAQSHWIGFVVGSFSLVCYSLATLLFTYTQYYQVHFLAISILTAAVMCALSLLPFVVYVSGTGQSDISPIGLFCLCILILLLIYTVIPLPLYLCILIGCTYSTTFEILSGVLTASATVLIVVRVLSQLCIHIMCIHILLMAEVRMRNTFMKVGQSLLVRRDLEMEKQLKEKIIHSVMPPKLAEALMASQDNEVDPWDQVASHSSSPSLDRRISASPRPSQVIFRRFNMHRMEDVSILFADIVGFTKMSCNKTAEQLVGLLNDLFGRFDQLCAKLGCEKISTLGDCYYCVSGCPEPRTDHAKCCVEMGLGMIKAIGEFDENMNEDVNMRVGVHTGTVLCGIVGTCRFKFDVWSNDVTFANLMESSGKPGKVHISETSYDFLHELYHVEEGIPAKGMKTFFIKGRKPAAFKRVHPTVTGRHSWPSHSICESLSKGQQHPQQGQRKPSSQSEKGQEDDGAAMPMLSTQQSSLSTLGSSRKDSGIRSRHSSLQDMMLDTTSIVTAHLLSHRVSGYYTSSQVSLADTGRGSTGSSVHRCSLLVDPNLSLNESLARLRYLRKQSDLQLIRCVQQDSSHSDYFVRPPINKCSLSFLDPNMEKEYRRRFHHKNPKDPALTLASPTLNTYLDIFVSAVFFMVVAFSCFLLFPLSVLWLLFFILGTCWLLFIILLCLCEILIVRGHCLSPCVSQMYHLFSTWFLWHLCGALLLCLPTVSVYANFSCRDIFSIPERTEAFCLLLLVSLVHFCNFAQLNCWMKSILAFMSGVTLIIIFSTVFCHCSQDVLQYLQNSTTFLGLMTDEPSVGSCHRTIIYELILDVLLLVILVWFLNQEFEISYRLSYHGGVLAAQDKRRIEMMKNQADWLLHNIIPKHVADQLKSTSKYSENHKEAGILFASIVNFHEMYDEGFEGGKEYLRVLNELVGDFDELLQKPEFKNVEKIKTIGSTFMAASGLNPKLRNENAHKHTHLFELMDFALAMQQVIERFNHNLLEFNFIMRIGYNFGDVTAGVIGTTKLYYDIWGDAVNTASRMDSHGVPDRIQVPDHCVPVLKELFELELRGGIYVKGKENMNVYLLVGKRPQSTESPNLVTTVYS